MKRVRSRLTILLSVIVIASSVVSLSLYFMLQNGFLIYRDSLDHLLFGLVLRDILTSLSSAGSSDTFFAAYADNLGGLQEALRKADVAKYCCIVVATVPAVLLYIFMQKYFVKGVMIGALKG